MWSQWWKRVRIWYSMERERCGQAKCARFMEKKIKLCQLEITLRPIIWRESIFLATSVRKHSGQGVHWEGTCTLIQSKTNLFARTRAGKRQHISNIHRKILNWLHRDLKKYLFSLSKLYRNWKQNYSSMTTFCYLISQLGHPLNKAGLAKVLERYALQLVQK